MRRRGISPVIATVILVAVAIAVAIAVAFWMTGIVGLFTGFEELQITSAFAEPPRDVDNDNTEEFVIHITVKNTGTSPATVDNVIIKCQPFDGTIIQVYYGDSPDQISNKLEVGDSFSINPGETYYINITFDINANWAGGQLGHGVSVEVKLHTAGGKEYPKLVVLP